MKMLTSIGSRSTGGEVSLVTRLKLDFFATNKFYDLSVQPVLSPHSPFIDPSCLP